LAFKTKKQCAYYDNTSSSTDINVEDNTIDSSSSEGILCIDFLCRATIFSHINDTRLD
jgi:hypothetical protein